MRRLKNSITGIAFLVLELKVFPQKTRMRNYIS